MVVCRKGGGISDDLVAGLAGVALKPPVGFFTEGIACRGEGHCEGLAPCRGRSTYPS